MHKIAGVNWNSGRDVERAARHVQSRLLARFPSDERPPRFRAVQKGLVPSQREIVEGLLSGLYEKELCEPA